MRAAPGVFTWPGILSGEPNRVSVLLPPSCSWHKFLRCLLTVFPFLEWMCLYRFKDWLLGDLLAGLSVGLVQVPQGKGNLQPSYQSWSPRPQRLPGASSCAGWTEGKHKSCVLTVTISPFNPQVSTPSRWLQKIWLSWAPWALPTGFAILTPGHFLPLGGITLLMAADLRRG